MTKFYLKDCFKKFWPLHKLNHAPKEYNPYPGFRYTGTLRPYPLVLFYFSLILFNLLKRIFYVLY